MSSWNSIADWIVALGTIGAVLMAVWQLRVNSRLADQNAATQMWLEYIRIGLQNPELGEGHIALKYLRVSNYEALVEGNTLKSQRYLWFLTLLLDTCETIILHKFTDRWKLTIETNLRYHKESLALFWPTEAVYYSREFGVLVEKVIAEEEPS